MELRLGQSHWDIMQAHVEAQTPLEACGLLAGKNDTVEQVLLVPNQAQSPIRFRMDPVTQLEAFHWMDANDLDLVGIFHSHPAGPEEPSATDILEAAYDVVQIIWSLAQEGWRARGFRIEAGKISEIKLQLMKTK